MEECSAGDAEVAGAGWLGVGRLKVRSSFVASLRTDGPTFFYHHLTQPAPDTVDFGVEVTRIFETAGEVYATETQGGEAAVAVHRGPVQPHGRSNAFAISLAALSRMEQREYHSVEKTRTSEWRMVRKLDLHKSAIVPTIVRGRDNGLLNTQSALTLSGFC